MWLSSWKEEEGGKIAEQSPIIARLNPVIPPNCHQQHSLPSPGGRHHKPRRELYIFTKEEAEEIVKPTGCKLNWRAHFRFALSSKHFGLSSTNQFHSCECTRRNCFQHILKSSRALPWKEQGVYWHRRSPSSSDSLRSMIPSIHFLQLLKPYTIDILL